MINRKSLRNVPDVFRLVLLQALEQHHGPLARATQRREARQEFLRQIVEYAEGGKVALCSWSRDCDMCEGTSRVLINADPKAIDRRIEHDLRYAEGPMRHWVQRPSDYFKSETRDRAMEAFEDGHPHVIYG